MRMRVSLLALVFVLAAAPGATAQTRVITGTVTHAVTGEPVDGARISVRGTIVTAVTRADGTYSIGVPVGTIELVFLRIGYARANVTVSASQSTVDVSLEADIFRLEEIVVTGRGTGIQRRNLPNAVATVSGEELNRVPAQSIEHALQGKVAGADILYRSRFIGQVGGLIQAAFLVSA